MDKKVIGIVLPNVPGYSETFFSSKIDGLRHHGYEVILFVGKGSEKKDFKVIKSWPISTNKLIQSLYMLIYMPALFLRAPEAIFRFIRLEKGAQPFSNILKQIYINGHILSEKLDWLHFGFATMSIKRENVAAAINARMAVSIRGFDIAIYPLKHPGCYKKLWQKVDKVHTISEGLLSLARASGMSRSATFVKITPAIDVANFMPSTKNRDENQKLRILTVARLHWVKGLEYALASMKQIKENNIDFEYVIAGEGSDYERLSFAAHQLGIDDHVKFVGKKNPSDIAKLMQEYSVYLQPSIHEGFCNAVLEAQASGMLCVVTDAGGLPENVLHEKTGWVVRNRNPKEWAETIISVHNLSPFDKAMIRKAAVERVEEQFNITQYQEKFNNFYF